MGYVYPVPLPKMTCLGAANRNQEKDDNPDSNSGSNRNNVFHRVGIHDAAPYGAKYLRINNDTAFGVYSSTNPNLQLMKRCRDVQICFMDADYCGVSGGKIGSDAGRRLVRNHAADPTLDPGRIGTGLDYQRSHAAPVVDQGGKSASAAPIAR